MVVTSNAVDFGLRSAQRDAFPSSLLAREGIRRVFLLARRGGGDGGALQARIEAENARWADLVQGDFEESYRHLSYKHLMGLQWASKYCQNAKYILKMDDDISVDVFQFLSKLDSEFPGETGRQMAGYLQSGLRPQRDPSSKWYVSEEERPESEYPDFLSGWAYALSSEVAADVVAEAESSDFFWIDDLWVTGVLAARVGASLTPLNSLYTVYVDHLLCCLRGAKVPAIEVTTTTTGEKYRCDFAVGPSMDSKKLIRDLGSLSRHCRERGCARRRWEQSVSRTCVGVLENPHFLPGSKGVGEVIVVEQQQGSIP